MPELETIRIVDEALNARVRSQIRSNSEATSTETITVNDEQVSALLPSDEAKLVVLPDDSSDTAHGQDTDESAPEIEHLQSFVADFAHDLRGPLAVVGGYIELARETGEMSHLHNATEALTRATRLLDHLKQLSEEGRDIADPKPVDLRVVAAAAWRAIETDDATLDIAGTQTIMADKVRLQQLFENLFRNAVEHGGPAVTVRVGLLAERGFYVADDGPGIPEGDRETVFEMGHSGDGSTGLGLTICNRIAGAHGWRIQVTEAPDGGARFEVSDVDLA
jgi:signal transduction histidine kinase